MERQCQKNKYLSGSHLEIYNINHMFNIYN